MKVDLGGSYPATGMFSCANGLYESKDEFRIREGWKTFADLLDWRNRWVGVLKQRESACRI